MTRLYSVDWTSEGEVASATEALVRALYEEGCVSAGPPPRPRFLAWFDRLQGCTASETAMTPVSLKLLYELAFAVGPRRIVGIGTFHGLAMSALAAGAWERRGSAGVRAVGVDVDEAANGIARANAARLGLEHCLSYVTADGAAYLEARAKPIDLVYLDLDDPLRAKAAYGTMYERAWPRLTPGAMVLAHDATNAQFAADLADLRRRLRRDGDFHVILDVPTDSAGLLVAASLIPSTRGEPS